MAEKTQQNPHPFFTDEWYAWKEQHEAWTPFHVGTTLAGSDCPSGLVRCILVGTDTYRCPVCGKEFPTFTAELIRKTSR